MATKTETKPGSTVCLFGCPAEFRNDKDTWEPTTLTGLFVLEEFWPCELSNYVPQAQWTVSRVGECTADYRCYARRPSLQCEMCKTYNVMAEDLDLQVSPDYVTYLHKGKLMRPVLPYERDMYFHEEDDE